MTSGTSMMAVGVYLILFGMIQEIEPFGWIGRILATIGFFVTKHYEDEYKYRIRRLEKALAERGGKNGQICF